MVITFMGGATDAVCEGRAGRALWWVVSGVGREVRGVADEGDGDAEGNAGVVLAVVAVATMGPGAVRAAGAEVRPAARATAPPTTHKSPAMARHAVRLRFLTDSPCWPRLIICEPRY